MNPFSYWYSSDPQIEVQWMELINRTEGKCSELLFSSIDKLFKEGSAQEKTQAISAALAIDYWMK